MKKLIAVFFAFTCFFALMLELSGTDPDKTWSWRGYVEYVTENIEPFPTAELTINLPNDGNYDFLTGVKSFFGWLGGLILYPFKIVRTFLHNAFVIVDGFLPFSIGGSDIPGTSIGEAGGGGSFGDFGGGGFGGGGGGIR